MRKDRDFLNWDNLSSVEKELVTKWIKSLLEAKAASEALVDFYNKANNTEEVESVNKDILLETKTDSEQLLAQDIGILFNKILDSSDQPYTGDTIPCLPLKIICDLSKTFGNPNPQSCQDYNKCIQNS